MTSMLDKDVEQFNKGLFRKYCTGIFDFIWNKRVFSRQGSFSQKFQTRFDARNSDTNAENIIHDLVGNIIDAVQVSIFYLRDYFCNFYKEATLPQTFKSDVKRLCFDWFKLSERENEIVKTIDMISIVALAFFHREVYEKTLLDLDDAIDWFEEIYQEHFKKEFFIGNVRKMNEESKTLYGDLFSKLKKINCFHGQWISSLELYRDCRVINNLRESSVDFFISEKLICENCKILSDDDYYYKVVYIRLEDEYNKDEYQETDTAKSTETYGENTSKTQSKVEKKYHEEDVKQHVEVSESVSTDPFSHTNTEETLKASWYDMYEEYVKENPNFEDSTLTAGGLTIESSDLVSQTEKFTSQDVDQASVAKETTLQTDTSTMVDNLTDITALQAGDIKTVASQLSDNVSKVKEVHIESQQAKNSSREGRIQLDISGDNKKLDIPRDDTSIDLPTKKLSIEDSLYDVYLEHFGNFVSKEKESEGRSQRNFFNILSETYDKKMLFDEAFKKDFFKIDDRKYSNPAEEMKNFLRSHEQSFEEPEDEQARERKAFFSQFELFKMKYTSFTRGGYLICKREEEQKSHEKTPTKQTPEKTEKPASP